jgi:hypothetical protein
MNILDGGSYIFRGGDGPHGLGLNIPDEIHQILNICDLAH